MKKINFLGILSGLVIFLNAQNNGSFFSSALSKKISCKQIFVTASVLGNDDDGSFYFMHVNANAAAKKMYYVDKFDKDLKLVASKQLNFNGGPGGKNAAFLGTVTLSNRIFFLTIDESGDQAVIKATEFNRSKLALSAEGKLIAKTGKTSPLQNVWHKLIVSPDGIRCVLLTCTSPASGKDQYHVSIFKADLNVEWDYSAEFPYSSSEYRVQDECLDPEGYFDFVLMAVPGGKVPNAVGSEIDYSKIAWKLVRIKSGEVKITDLNLRTGYISAAHMVCNKSDLSIYGFLSAGKGINEIGPTVIDIDGRYGNIMTVGALELSDELQFHKISAQGVSGTTDFWNVALSDVHLCDDSGFIWTAGQKFTTMQNSQTFETYASTTAVHVNANYTIGYVTKIPQFQHYNTAHITSPDNSFIYKDELYFLYLDNPENAKVTSEDKITVWDETRGTNPCVMLAKVNADGTYQKEMALNAGDDVKWMNPGGLVSVGNGTYVTWSSPGSDIATAKDYQLMKISIH